MCICFVGVLILYAGRMNFGKQNQSSRKTRYIPTVSILSKVQEENLEQSEKKKVAYLTFDDGPSEVTTLVLDTLKEKEVKATFFLVGEEITRERESIVTREKEEGHAIGIHTNTHKKCDLYTSYDSFFKDFKAAKEKIDLTTGDNVYIHRFPWGSNNGYLKSFYKNVSQELKKQEIKSFDWNVSGEDSLNDGISCNGIIKNVRKDYKKYSQPIILLHDSNSTKNTALALGDIIDIIRKDGYEFDTLNNREPYLFPDSWR